MKHPRKPITIQPQNIVREDTHPFETFLQWLKSLYYLFRTLLLVVFLATLAITIGLYTYRFYEKTPQSLAEAMDAVFRAPIPAQNTIFITAISGLAFAIIFYGEYIRSQLVEVQHGINGVSKFIAGITIIAMADINIFQIDFYHLIAQGSISHTLFEIVFGQVISLILIIFLLPVFKSLVKLIPIPYKIPRLEGKTRIILNRTRYFLISTIMIFAVTSLFAGNLTDHTFVNIGAVHLPPIRSGVFLASVGIVAFFYRPPRSLDIESSFSFGKLLLGVGCFIGIGLLYSQVSNSEMYVTYIAVSSFFTLLSWPILALLC
ncbi:MAG: hypothetical protein ACXQT0_01715 [Candidatus Methanofastidiosia archaeon]